MQIQVIIIALNTSFYFVEGNVKITERMKSKITMRIVFMKFQMLNGMLSI